MSLYLSLHTADPRIWDDPDAREANYEGYSRSPVEMPEVWDGLAVAFSPAVSGNQKITYFALRDSTKVNSEIVRRHGKPVVGAMLPTITVTAGVTPHVTLYYAEKPSSNVQQIA